MKSRLLATFMLLLPVALQAQETDQFATKAVLIVDEGSELSSQVSESMLREMAKISGLEIQPYSVEWNSDPHWVISVSIGTFDADPREKGVSPELFYVGVAFSRSETMLNERIVRREAKNKRKIDEATLISIMNAARQGIGEFKAMWLAHGRTDKDLEKTCRDAAKVLEENFIAPERRRFQQEKARQEAERRSKSRIR